MRSENSWIGTNISRLRSDRQLTQEELARLAGITRVTLGKVERGVVLPRASTLGALARSLGVSVRELVEPVPRLEGVRFRAGRRVHSREQILAEVAHWLYGYSWLERELDDLRPYQFASIRADVDPPKVARKVREAVGVGPFEPIRDICGLLEHAGVKVLLHPTQRESYFGLSVSSEGGGPAVVVNTWDRISVERWIFTAAHELGHLVLHPNQYNRADTGESKAPEREADAFASEFLMPATAFMREWDETRGHPLLTRVLKVKRIFRVSYKTILFRLVESGREPKSVWAAFQAQHKAYFGATLKRAEEPRALTQSEFAWDWRRAGEPERLSPHDFVEDRLWRLVRRALEVKLISLGRAGEIVGLTLDDMRMRARAWCA